MATHVMTVRRRRFGIALIVSLLLLGAIAGGLAATRQRPSDVSLLLGDGQYSVRVVTGGAEREKGLSGTAPLRKDQGMLFVFETDDRWGIWMKDMNYPIDILWLDSSKKVVHMIENASPSSYPSTTFRPETPARYVLELAAGSIDDASISIADQATFSVKETGGTKS